MALAGFIVALILSILELVGSYRLGSNLHGYFGVEMLLLALGAIGMIVSLIGIALHYRWGWPVMLIVWGLFLVNTLGLFAAFGSSLTLVLTLIVGVISVLVGFVAVDLWEPKEEDSDLSDSGEPLETYVDEEKPARKKASRKRAGRVRKNGAQ